MRKTSFPENVKIGHLTYKIRPMSAKIAHKERAYADIGIEDGIIRVQDNLPPALTAEKLLHEILHGAYDAWDIDPEWDEERTVSALARALTAILRDNPEVVKWLVRKVKGPGIKPGEGR